jgi:hypothetical protein
MRLEYLHHLLSNVTIAEISGEGGKVVESEIG